MAKKVHSILNLSRKMKILESTLGGENKLNIRRSELRLRILLTRLRAKQLSIVHMAKTLKPI